MRVCKHILKFKSLPAGLTRAHVLMESKHAEIQTHWEQVTVTRRKVPDPSFFGRLSRATTVCCLVAAGAWRGWLMQLDQRVW